MSKEENIVRTILKSEITWAVMIVGAVAGFFTQVIIPINSIQIHLMSIETAITSYAPKITQNSNDILVLQQQVNFIEQKK